MEDGCPPYEKLLTKLKEYARSQRLDGEAARGKQAVDINKTTKWADFEDNAQNIEEPAQTEEELKALANVTCDYCNKKGHYTSQCPLNKERAREHERARAKERARARAKARPQHR